MAETFWWYQNHSLSWVTWCARVVISSADIEVELPIQRNWSFTYEIFCPVIAVEVLIKKKLID